jgi:hypothetical protein
MVSVPHVPALCRESPVPLSTSEVLPSNRSFHPSACSMVVSVFGVVRSFCWTGPGTVTRPGREEDNGEWWEHGSGVKSSGLLS